MKKSFINLFKLVLMIILCLILIYRSYENNMSIFGKISIVAALIFLIFSIFNLISTKEEGK